MKDTFAVRGIRNSVSFVDGFPFLVANEASLADLNAHIGGSEAMVMNRFRPNIVVKGAPAFDEDRWAGGWCPYPSPVPCVTLACCAFCAT